MSEPDQVVVIGASAGGVEALRELTSLLPAELPAAVCVVLHLAPGGASVLPAILARGSALEVVAAEDDAPLERGTIYVAVTDHHLMIEDRRIRSRRGPRENSHRPAVDPLFRSAAAEFGPRATAVVLSGAQDDGTLGAHAIKAAGGRVLAQEPDEALYPSMPENVIEQVGADAVAGLAGLAEIIANGAHLRPREGGEAMQNGQPANGPEHDPEDGHASGFTCPECGGAMFEDHNGAVKSYSCHVGHVYTSQTFVAEHGRSLEAALWSAVRRLEERAGLMRRMASREGFAAAGSVGQRFEAQAVEAEQHATTIRELVINRFDVAEVAR